MVRYCWPVSRSIRRSCVPRILFITRAMSSPHALQFVEVVPEDLDRDLRTHAGDHLVDALGDRLMHDEADAGKVLQLLADLPLEGFLGPAGGPLVPRQERDHRIGVAVRLRIGGRLAAPDLETTMRMPGTVMIRFDASISIRRTSSNDMLGIREIAGVIVFSFSVGMNDFPSSGNRLTEKTSRPTDTSTVIFGFRKRCREKQVVPLHEPDRRGVLLVPTLQEVRAQGGRQREREHQRRGQRDGDRVGERREHLAFHALQRHEGQEHQDDDADAVDHGLRDLLHRLEDDPQLALALAMRELSEGVLDHHHRAVDDETDGDREAAERHQVRRDSELVHRHEGDERCEHERCHDDQAGSEVAEEHEQHHDDQRDALDQHLDDGPERRVDQLGAVVEGDDLQAAGQHPLGVDLRPRAP
jgi:hypothetical protein